MNRTIQVQCDDTLLSELEHDGSLHTALLNSFDGHVRNGAIDDLGGILCGIYDRFADLRCGTESAYEGATGADECGRADAGECERHDLCCSSVFSVRMRNGSGW